MNSNNRLFSANRWKIAYRINKSNFKYVSFPRGFWGADPFLLKRDGKIYVYCEYTNERKSKSFISFKELFPNEEKKWHTAFEFEGHTSYPCVFEHNGELFMIPETTFDKSVKVLKLINNEWEEYSCLLSDINAPDTTFFKIDSKPYIFVYQIFSRDNRLLHICELNNELTQIVKDIAVKKYTAPDGRPGGNCFSKDGKLYRVIQPGITRYGEKICIANFGFDGKSYNEKIVCEILPSDICVKERKHILGVHTFNKLDDIEIIDLLVKGKFDIFRPFKLLFKRLHIFGFGQYEKDRIFIDKKFDKNN